ncbi:hypothetical protein JTB14_007521 [Gonioctena quinquepunctata]|nr:hypothetical protein JTB14_007521 [Gonioctena quinquepunctata]
MIVMKQPCNPENGLILHISASKIKFLEVAEEMELMKEDRNGHVREFSVASLEDFLPEDKHVDDLFTTAEKQSLVRYELENIRALAEDDYIPGYPTYSLYVGQSILQVCQAKGVITKNYSLHDDEALKKLGKKWYMSLFSKQPFEEIRWYFGESVALYFTFLGFYTYALAVPVFLGFLQMLVSRETVPFFCIFNVVWVTLLLEDLFQDIEHLKRIISDACQEITPEIIKAVLREFNKRTNECFERHDGYYEALVD